MRLLTYLVPCVIISILLALYGVISLIDTFCYDGIDENTNIKSVAVTSLEAPEASESLRNIPAVTTSWNELKSLVEAPEGSEEVLESNSLENSEEIAETVEVVDEKVTYFDVPLNEELQDHIFEQCESIGVKPEIVISMIARESMFKSDIIGDNGRAFGLMQIHPRWHWDRMVKLGCNDLLNPFENVTVGVDILRELLGYGKSIEWVLMAYNGGASYANRLAAEGRVSDYASDVLERAEEMKKGDKNGSVLE